MSIGAGLVLIVIGAVLRWGYRRRTVYRRDVPPDEMPPRRTYTEYEDDYRR